MDDNKFTIRKLGTVLGILACLGLLATMSPRVAETNQGDVGISQPPLVTIIFDTSSSMQWTEQGEGQYPVFDDSYDTSGVPYYPERHLHTWESGQRLGFSASREYTSDGLVESYAHFSGGDNRWKRTVGPCMVWQPAHDDGDKDWDHQHCDEYLRPPPAVCASEDSDGDDIECDDEYPAHPGDWYGDMEDAEQEMYDSEALRLRPGNTPRHIQIKQVLTGDMHMGEYNAPGCWFVPRFRGATSEEQVCCEYVDDDGNCCIDDDCSDDPSEEDRIFDRYIDYDDPIPHYQEVYDTQLDNGVLDAMGSTALFSMVAFDGYRRDGLDGRGLWNYPTNDIVAGSAVYDSDEINWWSAYSDTCGENEDDSDCYDMGFFRFIGPAMMNLSDSELMNVSEYVQKAILDAGFLEHYPDDEDYYRTLTSEDADGAPVYDYPLGRQPIAQSSPFGPVFHDLHQFYIHGQVNMGADNSESDHPHLGPHLTDPTDSSLDSINPFDFSESNDHRDPYLACRGRHAVLFTDGIAEPEAPGGAGSGLGAEILEGGAFGYLPEDFPYLTAEDAIHEMVMAVEEQMESASATGDIDPQFIPRVHILGVGVMGEQGDAGLRTRVLDKMGAMAEKGRTCAQYYLPPEIVPEGVETGQLDEDDNYIEGACDTSDPDTACLVEQDYSGYMFTPPDEDAVDFQCEHPAVILSHDDRGTLREAFQLIFNEIAGLSGLAAQTRPSITNYVDRASDEVGQYRLYSGFRVAGDNPHWQGLLNRQFLECGTDGLIDEDGGGTSLLHEDLTRLRAAHDTTDTLEEIADSSTNGADRRRVFTSAPKFISEYVDEDEVDWMDSGSLRGTSLNSSLFSSSYHLFEAESSASQSDNFGGEYDIAGATGSEQEGTRLPFDRLSLFETLTNSSGADMDDDDFYDYWRAEDEDEFRNAIDDYRGRTTFRSDRVLGAIRYSDPVSVGPPARNLTIDSYRRFQREYGNRLTMTYMTTLDGQLRAIHTGEPDSVLVQKSLHGDGDYAVDTGGESDDGEAQVQREAWAYIPQLIHRDLVNFAGSTAPDALMDGSPVVEDIRLCTRGESFASNKRVCPEGGPASQWRTVLVQGLGQAGQGYFALDITRPGFSNDTRMPDPIALWEFGPDWEAMQISRMGNGESWRYKNVDHDVDSDDDCVELIDSSSSRPSVGDEDIEDMWELSAMGASVGQPAIGMVNMEVDSGSIVQRPIAVFGGGNRAGVHAMDPFSDRKLESCTEHITGRSVYVVDLQSGQLLRRFIGDDDLNEVFEAEITGTPVLSAGSPAEVSTRGFIGDGEGRMYRMDFSNPDPEDWKIRAFYDPWENDDDFSNFDADSDVLGPADFKPAVAMNNNREMVVVYGLGGRGDSGGQDTVQAVISLRESFDYDDVSEDWSVDSEVLWIEEFEGSEPGDDHIERITGSPVIFNNDAYFTSYSEHREDQCAAGHSRIYRLGFESGNGGWVESEVEKSLDESQIYVDNDQRFIRPNDPMLIRGMAITMGPDCSRAGTGNMGRPAPKRQPQLVAQTSGGSIDSADDASDGTGGGEVGGIGTISVGLEVPETQSIPMSWSVLEQ